MQRPRARDHPLQSASFVPSSSQLTARSPQTADRRHDSANNNNNNKNKPLQRLADGEKKKERKRANQGPHPPPLRPERGSIDAAQANLLDCQAPTLIDRRAHPSPPSPPIRPAAHRYITAVRCCAVLCCARFYYILHRPVRREASIRDHLLHLLLLLPQYTVYSIQYSSCSGPTLQASVASFARRCLLRGPRTPPRKPSSRDARAVSLMSKTLYDCATYSPHPHCTAPQRPS